MLRIDRCGFIRPVQGMYGHSHGKISRDTDLSRNTIGTKFFRIEPKAEARPGMGRKTFFYRGLHGFRVQVRG